MSAPDPIDRPTEEAGVDQAGLASARVGRPRHFLMVGVGSVFAVELLIMLLLPLLPSMSPLGEALVDASLLTLVLLPALYLIVYRPLSNEILQRRSADEARRDVLGEAAYSGRLLMALSRAAEAVQRARAPDEVYRAVADEVALLGFHAWILMLDEDRSHLTLTRIDLDPFLLRAAEHLTGLPAEGYRIALKPGSSLHRVVAEGTAVFIERFAADLAEVLPATLRPLAGRVAAVMGIREAISAPLTAGGERFGVLTVTGSGLTEADVPAVTIFAGQAAIALENVRLYQEALAKVRTLGGLLPICAHCKKIRDDEGYWSQIESYIAHHTEAEFSHGICPDCAREVYPEHSVYAGEAR